MNLSGHRIPQVGDFLKSVIDFHSDDVFEFFDNFIDAGFNCGCDLVCIGERIQLEDF
jgi:hypothetical protein